MSAATIDEVILSLEEIIKKTKSDQNPMGYFAALYCKVTRKVKEGIIAGVFEDAARMERLDVIFANRYLDAYYQYNEHIKATSCWELTFKNSTEYHLIVLQHLLLGMNAHINLDLAIAAAQTSEGGNIDSLKNDFNKINEILGSLVKSVESELSQVWPTLKYILRATSKADTFLIDFSMELARDGAWCFAQELALLTKEQQLISIEKRDAIVTQKAKIVTNSGFIARLIFMIMRHYENGSVADKIEILR